MAINIGNYGKTGTYEQFVLKMVDNQVTIIREKNESAIKYNNLTPADYFETNDNSMEMVICPEPISFLKDITKYDTSGKRQEAFLELTKKFKKSRVIKPENNIWFNKTSNGINIRLGNVKGDTGNQEPAPLGDDCVHGVVVGRTGAGKSVLINNVILNLITEYSPWEIDLFLVDMKKVELSRYMANTDDGSYLTPHVSVCGATSEVRYVVSMIQYLSDCMKARQTLFAALGIQKIKDFREKYSKELGVNFVLPRILLLVDEFQQMFLEASNKEKKILNECITAITKLGRATGVHLLFASQEMSGALGSKELANFKLRIALPCDATISEQILGNSAASRVEEKGITLVNKKGGSKEEDNIEYRTPFINDKEDDDGFSSEFQRYLNIIHENAVKLGFVKVQKFYQEDTQDKMEKIRIIRESKSVKKQVNDYLVNNPALIDAFILGTGVLYTNKKNDFESFFIERGKKRNIGILCSKDNDIGNTLKTLVENFGASSNKYEHTVIYESEILRSVYSDMINDLEKNSNLVEEENYQEFFDRREKKLNTIISSINYLSDRKKIYMSFIEKYIKSLSKSDIEMYVDNKLKDSYNDKTFVKQAVDIIDSIQGIENDDAIGYIIDKLKEKYLNLTKKIEGYKNKSNLSTSIGKKEDTNELTEKTSINVLGKILNPFSATSKNRNDNLIKYYNILVESIKNKKYMGPISVIWLIGTDNIDKSEDKMLAKIMENCTNHSEIYILAGSSPENLEMSYKCCNYIFLNSLEEKLYTKYKMSFTKKGDDNKTIDFKIINYNQERSYKQLFFECKAENAPKLDFEEIEV